MTEARSETVVLHPLVGRDVLHYRVEGVLGQGGMGVVYRASDTKLQRPVALKLLPGEWTLDEERRRRFLREARAAARVIHPVIAQVYDVDEFEGATFIAMEWVDGRTVRDLVRAKELDLLGSIDIAVQVAEGLAKAHDMGIVHRDIKPANVMMTKDGHVKVLDFGLAKQVGDTGVGTDLTMVTQTATGQVMGTAAYMSPEQVKGLPVDGRSDIFSLGVMLFEMATGELPFERATAMETMQAVAFDDTPSVHRYRQDLPPGLQRIVARCLQKRAQDRYGDARQLAQDLRVLRRDTESGIRRLPWWREWTLDAWDRVSHLRASQVVWMGVVGVALAVLLYPMFSNASLGGVWFFMLLALLLFRYVRNRPQRMLELFVRRVSKIPEVHMIVAQEHRLMVVVDRAPGQLYGRISQQLNLCNRKLFFGRPMEVTVRHDLGAADVEGLMNGPGVQYVRH
ncbi:MAG: serine/threonine-protein kinase [Limisphaerales bacterium]